MTSRVGPKGQVVLPKRIRDRLGIKAGDEVVVEEVDGEARVRRVPSDASLLGLLAGDGGDLLGELEAEHEAELEREDRLDRS